MGRRMRADVDLHFATRIFALRFFNNPREKSFFRLPGGPRC